MSDLGIVVVHVSYACFYSYTAVTVQTWRCHGSATSVFVCVCVCGHAHVSWHLCHVGRQSFTAAANYVGLCVSLFLIVHMCYMYVYRIV